MKRIHTLQITLTLLLYTAFTNCNLFAQLGQTYGGPESDYGYQVEATPDGGFAVAGRTLSFGAGDMDYWLAKFDSTGAMQWNKTLGTSTYDQLMSLRMAADGGYLISGLTGAFNSSLEGALLYKVNADSQVILSRQIDYNKADHAHVLFENLEGGYYMAGHTDSKGDAGGDIWVVKLDTAFNTVWDSAYGPKINAPEHAHAAALTPDSGLIVLAHTDVQGLDKYRVLKINKHGNQQWAQTYSGGNMVEDVPYEVRVTRRGNYAFFGASVSIGGSTAQVWLKVVDTAGNSVIDKHYQTGGGYNFCWSGRQTDDDGFLMIGFKSPGANGSSDLLLLKTDSMGNMQWYKQYGGALSDIGYGYAQLNNGKFVLVGSTVSAFSGGSDDMWVILLDSLQAPVDTSTTGIASTSSNTTLFPNPANNVVHVQTQNTSGVVTVSILNLLGETLLTEQHSSDSFILNVSQLPAGIYNIITTSTNTIASSKLIIQKK